MSTRLGVAPQPLRWRPSPTDRWRFLADASSALDASQEWLLRALRDHATLGYRPSHPVLRALQTGEAQLVHFAGQRLGDWWTSPHLPAVRALSPTSCIAVPLTRCSSPPPAVAYRHGPRAHDRQSDRRTPSWQNRRGERSGAGKPLSLLPSDRCSR